MSEDQLNSFLAKLKLDAELQKQVKEASSVDAVIEIASSAGFTISKEALISAGLDSEWSELTDEDLEDVAGGARPRSRCRGTNTLGCTPPPPPSNPQGGGG